MWKTYSDLACSLAKRKSQRFEGSDRDPGSRAVEREETIELETMLAAVESFTHAEGEDEEEVGSTVFLNTFQFSRDPSTG